MKHLIVTPEEMRRAEAACIDKGTSGYTLMQRAGAGVAAHLHRRFPEGSVRILCGPGGNGGDGFVAARALKALGRNVDVFSLKPPGPIQGDAAQAAHDWNGPVAPLEAARGSGHDITLDALFGGGLSRPLDPLAAALAEEGGQVVSLDVPSGLNGLTATSQGACFTADLTVTFQALRPAHVLVPGRAVCGSVETLDIGVAVPQGCGLNDPADWLGAFPWPREDSHKHARGRLVVVTGGLAQTGAARLAARAGLRAGAGLVTLLCPPSALLVVASQITAEMVTSVATPEALAAEAEEADAAVIGPAAGVDPPTRDKVLALLGTPARAVLDADALTVFRDDPGELFDALRPGDVLTPHPGEFRRLFGDLLKTAPNRIEATREAALQAGCTVLLKGPDTVIAHPGGRTVVNTHAAPWLATAGSGDVLAGLIGGLMAQGMESFAATCAGAWMHGDAAIRFGPGLIATDLEGEVPHVLRALRDLPA